MNKWERHNKLKKSHLKHSLAWRRRRRKIKCHNNEWDLNVNFMSLGCGLGWILCTQHNFVLFNSFLSVCWRLDCGVNSIFIHIFYVLQYVYILVFLWLSSSHSGSQGSQLIMCNTMWHAQWALQMEMRMETSKIID